MEKFSIVLILFVCLLYNKSFSQDFKGGEKFQSDFTQITISDLEGKAYCSSTYTNQSDDWITHVSFNSISNYTGQDGPSSYGDYTFSHITGIVTGTTYTLSVSFYSSGSYTQHVRAWFDWNDDDVFEASESYYLGSGVDATLTASITVPVWADPGDSRFRIIEQYSTDPGADGACDGYGNHTTTYGETEDYTFVIYSNSYCQASGGCDEFIWIVEFPDHGYSHSSGCIGYEDFAPYWSIPVPINTSAYITVLNGNPIYPQDQCGIWVDWNRDDDFYDAYEQITVNGSPGVGPYSATLVPPPGATLGECVVRIRIQYTSGSMDPCGIMPYGEVEDYRINLLPEVPCTWTGAVDNNWHNPDNWNTVHIPGATDDVIIPNVTNKCWVYVYGATAECNNLTVESGTIHDLRIYNTQLTVHGNMEVYGYVTLDHPSSELEVEGTINWQSGSTLYIPDLTYAIVEVHGDWITQSGSNIYFNHGLLSFEGTGGSYLRTFSNNCNLYDLAAYKTGATQWVSVSINSTQDLNINGRIMVMDDDILYIYSPHDVNLVGDLDIMGQLYCYDGDFIFDGDVQEIDEHLSYTTTCEFNNLKVSSNTSTTILNKDITINNNLTIQSGQFVSNNKTITIEGDWNNQVGPSAFDEGTGRVKWIGSSPWTEIHSNEDFYILEIDKTSSGFLNIWGPIVTCQQYDWTSGGISVRMGGEFTAFDLLDNGIYGMWGIDNTGGTINISNYGGYVDLNGQISINGGTMNVYGGTTPSYWPYVADAGIQMMDGVLDFHDQGIYIFDSPTYTLTESITGGTIRTAGGFWGESNNFSPEYGTMEFYSPTDASIYTINNCNLNDVVIAKSTKNPSSPTSQPNNLVDERSGKSIGNGTKSNMLTQTELVYIHGSLVINNGFLNSNGYDILIEEDWTNNIGDAGFIESTGSVGFVGYNKVSEIHTNETFYDLLCSNASSGIFGLTLMDGIIVQVNNDLDIYNSALEMNYDSELHVNGDVYIGLGGGLNADDGANILSVGGNWTNENSNNTQYYGYWKGGEVVTFNGAGDQILNTDDTEETFGNIVINKTGGFFKPNDDIHVHGALIIQDGDWWDNVAGLDHWLTGHVLLEATGGYYPLGTTTFKGLNFQTYQSNGGIAQFGDIVIDKHYTKGKNTGSDSGSTQENTKAGTLQLNSIMTVYNNHTTTIEEGTFDLNGNSYKSHGDIYINDGGILEVDAGAWCSIVSGLYVHNGGQFVASGASGNKARVWKDVVGFYDFQVFSGGTISANYTDFEDMNENGIWVQDGAYVDPINSFNNCDFISGINTAPSLRLVIDNDQILNISYIDFDNNPFLAGTYNVGKTISHGEITVTTTGGNFTGPLYEYDPYSIIHWTDYPHGRWTGNVSSDWFDPMNWADFNVPGAASDVVIPSGTPNDPVINNFLAYCQDITIETGASLEIGNSELHITNDFDNHGQLIMTNGSGKLYASDIDWSSGSSANVTAGEIHGSWWTWGNGTNASLGTGSTVFLDSDIDQYDDDASFGNLTLSWGDEANGSYPIRVSGDLIMVHDAEWDSNADWIIDGECTIGHDATLFVQNGAHFLCNSTLAFIQASELFIMNNSMVTVHGLLNFNYGFMVIENSSFICDYSLPSGWIDIGGGIDMISGSLEFPDANISFIGGQYISGGTIIAGRSVHADIAGIFQPGGGTLELIGSDLGHYVQIRNGNYLHDLNINRTESFGIHPGSPLIVMGSVNVNSEFMLQGNTMVVVGDLDINGGGILNVNDNALLAMDDNSWLAVNTGGTLEVIGSAGNEAYISHNTGYYHFWTGYASTIKAKHAVFEFMAPEGILLNPGAFVDPAFSFDNCTFTDGYAGGRLLTINSDQNFNVTDAIFPANTWSGSYNVYKDVDDGSVNFDNATGAFAGDGFEYDPYNRVHWDASLHTVYGNVTYLNVISSPLSDINVTLMDGTVPLASDVSDINGDFNFPGIAPGNYHIESTTTKPWGGLSMNDVQFARQYVTNQPPGNGLSGLLLQAADVDISGLPINMNDVQFMRQKVIGQSPGFPEFWIFEEPSVIVTGGMGTQNFQGVCAGDTDGSYTPPVK